MKGSGGGSSRALGRRAPPGRALEAEDPRTVRARSRSRPSPGEARGVARFELAGGHPLGPLRPGAPPALRCRSVPPVLIPSRRPSSARPRRPRSVWRAPALAPRPVGARPAVRASPRVVSPPLLGARPAVRPRLASSPRPASTRATSAPRPASSPALDARRGSRRARGAARPRRSAGAARPPRRTRAGPGAAPPARPRRSTRARPSGQARRASARSPTAGDRAVPSGRSAHVIRSDPACRAALGAGRADLLDRVSCSKSAVLRLFGRPTPRDRSSTSWPLGALVERTIPRG